MKLFVHIALMLVFITACPFVGNSQNLPAKISKSIKCVPSLRPSIGKVIPIGANVTHPSISDKTTEYSRREKKISVTPPVIKNVPTVIVPICKIDSTVFEDANNIRRMRLIITMSTERLDSSMHEWLSLGSTKDPYFAYEEYKFEKSRLKLLKTIAMSYEALNNSSETLKRMEAIYNREAIVLPNIKIVIPKGLQ